jgi:hypothetical protein
MTPGDDHAVVGGQPRGDREADAGRAAVDQGSPGAGSSVGLGGGWGGDDDLRKFGCAGSCSVRYLA